MIYISSVIKKLIPFLWINFELYIYEDNNFNFQTTYCNFFNLRNVKNGIQVYL